MHDGSGGSGGYGGVVQDGSHTPANRLTETCSVSLLRPFLIYWISMLWSIDTCQNKESADQYHVTTLQAQI